MCSKINQCADDVNSQPCTIARRPFRPLGTMRYILWTMNKLTGNKINSYENCSITAHYNKTSFFSLEIIFCPDVRMKLSSTAQSGNEAAL